MIKAKYFLFVMLFLLVAGHAIAQDKELANVQYAFSTLKYNDTSANTRQLDIKFRLPLYKKSSNLVGATIGYKNVHLHQFPDSYSTNLHGLIIQGAWAYNVTQRSSFTFFAQVGLFSDMLDINGKDFRYGAGFRYRFVHSEKLSTGWGLAYSRQFFGNQVVPFIDVDFRPNQKWTISGQFPIKPKILYHVNGKMSVGLELNGEAASYRLSATESGNRFVQINQWTGSTKLEYRFADLWQLNLGIGRNFKQSYKLFDNTSTTPWTIITLPIGHRPDPIQKMESSGLTVQVGISLKPFRD